jgi:hypothetical protein
MVNMFQVVRKENIFANAIVNIVNIHFGSMQI